MLAMGARAASSAQLRRFFAEGSLDGASIRFADGEEAHARRVLRLAPGDRALAIDGKGCERPCLLVAEGRGLALVPDGPAQHHPAPGQAGSPLPHITVAVPWPRGDRGEAMLERLVQWGVARVRPLLTAFTGPGERWRPERLERIARESLKQCRGTHLPELLDPAPLSAALPGARGRAYWLDPGADRSLARELAAAVPPLAPGPGEAWPSPIAIVVGPEGGFRDDERALLAGAGAIPAALAPQILRIETAAEGAVALVVGTVLAVGAADARPRDPA
ncbi:MAG: RsmE family RNA methyltransferase [Planctomycetaceae bacterium]|nr:RsmE family RNA methyltransferase [Planctomycetaceae bacterium]